MNNNSLVFASITKKVIMAIAGLFLIVFLLVHLTINLFLLRGDGGLLFNEAAHFMATNIFIKIFEVVLFGTIVVHVIYGIILQLQNWMSRPVRYKIKNKSETPFLSKYMIYTGGVIFVFLLIHFVNFYFRKVGLVDNNITLENGEPNFYNVAVELFKNSTYSFLYIALMALLGFHLYHAFESAFQTLGLNHSKYTPVVKVCSTIYAVIVTIGFCIIPLYFLFIY